MHNVGRAYSIWIYAKRWLPSLLSTLDKPHHDLFLLPASALTPPGISFASSSARAEPQGRHPLPPLQVDNPLHQRVLVPRHRQPPRLEQVVQFLDRLPTQRLCSRQSGGGRKGGERKGGRVNHRQGETGQDQITSDNVHFVTELGPFALTGVCGGRGGTLSIPPR